MQNQLAVWMNDVRVGVWTVSPNSVDEFSYDTSWLDDPRARPISLSMPLRSGKAPYKGAPVQRFFDNLLPESESVRERVALRYGLESVRPFNLLTEIGRDCVGAIQLTPPDAIPTGTVSPSEPLTEREVAHALRQVTTPSLMPDVDDDDFRISIAGAQEKTAFLRDGGRWYRPSGSQPSTHIFKLPLGSIYTSSGSIDLTNSVENEWFCSRVIAAFGLPVAVTDISDFEDQHVLVVERFDRVQNNAGDWLRLPQEDLCQALQCSWTTKYEKDGGPGIEAIMTLLLGASDAPAQRRRFFKTQLLFWLLAAPDGHAKNFSVFIKAGGRYELTPLYDVLSAYPVMRTNSGPWRRKKLKMAMGVHGKSSRYGWDTIMPRHWHTMAKRCRIENEIDDLIEEVINQVEGVIARVNDELPAGFPAAVSDPILAGVEKATQRLRTQGG